MSSTLSKRTAVIAFGIVLLSHFAIAQGLYITKLIDLKDSINGKFSFRYIDTPGSILIAGYLNGEIKGYSYRYEETVKSLPPTADQLPEPWEARKEYYTDESVWYNGHAYRAAHDVRAGTHPDKDQESWITFQVYGEPYSITYHFPSSTDTLSSSTIPDKMMFDSGELIYGWNSEMDYFVMDRVSYDGKAYEALRDPPRGVAPDKDPESWMHTSFRGPQFMLAGDVTGLSLVSLLRKDESNVVEVPQMITADVMHLTIGGFMNIVHFDYNDAIQYLAKKDLPIAHSITHGYAGSPSLFIDDLTKPLLLEVLIRNLQSKKLKVSKKEIHNKAAYDEMLGKTKTFPDDLAMWNIIQHPGTGNFELLKVEYFDETVVTRLATIESKKVLPLVSKSTFEFLNYMDVAQSQKVNFYQDTVRNDSLPRKYNERLPIPARRPYRTVFYDEYSTVYDSTDLTTNQQAFDVAQSMFSALGDERLKLKPRLRSFYPWTKTWKDFTIMGWRFDELQLGRNWVDRFDLNTKLKEVTSIRVVYKKTLDTVFKPAVPVEVSFNFTDEAGNYHYDYAVSWADLKKELSKDPKHQEFTKKVEAGTLPFSASEIAYGLKEEH